MESKNRIILSRQIDDLTRKIKSVSLHGIRNGDCDLDFCFAIIRQHAENLLAIVEKEIGEKEPRATLTAHKIPDWYVS